MRGTFSSQPSLGPWPQGYEKSVQMSCSVYIEGETCSENKPLFYGLVCVVSGFW